MGFKSRVRHSTLHLCAMMAKAIRTIGDSLTDLGLVDGPESLIGVFVGIVLQVNSILVEQILKIGPECCCSIPDLKRVHVCNVKPAKA